MNLCNEVLKHGKSSMYNWKVTSKSLGKEFKNISKYVLY